MSTQSLWITIFRDLGALWFHDGNPLRPHALLTSGKHSNGYFDSDFVMENPVKFDACVTDLVSELDSNMNIKNVDRVVGPAMGAIILAHDIARQIGYRSENFCLCGYTEKETDEGARQMVFRRTEIEKDERVLLVEDVITTGQSVELTAEAVIQAGGEVLPFVCTLVNRSNLTEISGKKIIALVNYPMMDWEPQNCPLCLQGSEAIRPKSAKSWARLNANH